MKPGRRRLLGLSLALLAAHGCLPAAAQPGGAVVAVPLYTPPAVIDGLYRHWAPPRTLALVQEAANLQHALQDLCAANTAGADAALTRARKQWQQAVAAWEGLGTVAFGPLIARRASYQIDFTPTRPKLIKRAIARAPQGAAEMELVGTPAKGLPALEWLLWTQPLQPATPGCAYAVEVGADIGREAQALQADFTQAAAAQWSDEDIAAGFTEFLNQWVGALERLRWQQIERPVREAATAGSGTPFPRAASGTTADSWARQWRVVRALGALSSAAPQPGHGVVPIEAYLRGRGHSVLAERWVQQLAQADAAMRALRPDSPERLLAAAKSLGALKRMAEEEVAPAMEISIGFSSADGD